MMPNGQQKTWMSLQQKQQQQQQQQQQQHPVVSYLLLCPTHRVHRGNDGLLVDSMTEN
jgi:hypothetical protein